MLLYAYASSNLGYPIYKPLLFSILMHLQMKRNVLLDDAINLSYPATYCQTSLRYVGFHWLTSEYMQLASSFMQLTAAGRRRNKVHVHCLFEGKMLIVH